jgi:hypothetical protein
LEDFLRFEPTVALSRPNGRDGGGGGGRHFGETVVPRLLSCTMAFALKLRKNHGKTSVRVAEKYHLGTIQLVDLAAVSAASTDPLTLDTLGLRKYLPSCGINGVPLIS